MSSRKRTDRPATVAPASDSESGAPVGSVSASSGQEQWTDRRSVYIGVVIMALMVAAGVIVGVIDDSSSDAGNNEPNGVQRYQYEGGEIVDGPVHYAEVPPVGGPHASVWQTCGYYDGVVVPERAVASLERGAVWITYRPDLDEQQKAVLAEIARSNSEVLVSAYDGLPSAIVVSSWNHQLVLGSVTDPRLNEFIRVLQNSEEAPDPDAPCSGGSSELATPAA